jgi:hypothetical protein
MVTVKSAQGAIATGQTLNHQNRVALLVCDKQLILIKLAPVESTTYGRVSKKSGSERVVGIKVNAFLGEWLAFSLCN